MDCLILQETPTRSSNEIILICANNAGMIDNSRTCSFSFATTLGILYNLSYAKPKPLNTFQQKAAYKMSDVHWISRVRLRPACTPVCHMASVTRLPTYVRTYVSPQILSNAFVSYPYLTSCLLVILPHCHCNHIFPKRKTQKSLSVPPPPSLVCTCIHITSPVSSRMALPASQSVISWDGLHTKPGCCNCCNGWPQS